MSTAFHASDAQISGDDGYQDTIGLLQEEIARLEGELRLRDEAAGAVPARAEEPGPAGGDGSSEKVAELSAEICKRDETITLLWEQVVRLEEAETASKAEWDQLRRWVDEVEQRVEAGGASAALQAELDAERRRSEQLRGELDSARRTWNARQQELEAKLAARIAQSASADPARAGKRGAAPAEPGLEEKLAAQLAMSESEVETLRKNLDWTKAELEASLKKIRVLSDDLVRMRKEHEAELATARATAAREATKRNDEALSPDERIRALRQHLMDIHQNEQPSREAEGLASRISRLWRRTGPAR
jgi:hypothetical protein